MPEKEPYAIVDGHPVEETWYQRTVRVAGYGADFNSIQAAINYAVTQTPTAAGRWTVLVYPGTYDEQVTMAQYVDVLGIDKESVIISGTNVTAVTMANDSRIANLTINMLATAAGSAYGIELNDAGCRIEDINMYVDRDGTGGLECVGIIENTGNTVRTIYIRNVHIESDIVTNTNTHGISIRQDNKVVRIEESYVIGSDYGMAIGVTGGAGIGSTIYSKQNFFMTTSALARAVFNNGGHIYLHEDSIAMGCRLLRENAGLILYTDGNDVYHVFEGMDIQEALDATSGEVYVHEGTWTVTASIVMDSYQTLRGSGRSTIITTSVADLDIITATGGAGTEKVGILIADLCVDGTAGGVVNDIGILWTYVDDSKISHCWLLNCSDEEGIELDHCDRNEIIANHCSGCTDGIFLTTSEDNTISGNVCNGNQYGILLYYGSANTIVGNTCSANTRNGIDISGDDNSITGNTCRANSRDGININGSNWNTVSGNTCGGNTWSGIVIDTAVYTAIVGNTCHLNHRHGISLVDSTMHTTLVGNNCCANSQESDISYDNIYVNNSDYNLIAVNLCRYAYAANEPRYGINISDAASNNNTVQGNDLSAGGKTANFNDAGTLTIVEEDNREIGVPQVKRYVYMKNTSGGALAAGDVVIFKSVAAGDEFTTTAVLGDDHVLGMVAEAINNDAYGYVLVAGKTTVLSASNDHGNIVIGDFLCCNDTATEACKAGAGHTTFAIALEACAAANCTLDALLINPLTF